MLLFVTTGQGSLYFICPLVSNISPVQLFVVTSAIILMFIYYAPERSTSVLQALLSVPPFRLCSLWFSAIAAPDFAGDLLFTIKAWRTTGSIAKTVQAARNISRTHATAKGCQWLMNVWRSLHNILESWLSTACIKLYNWYKCVI